MIKYVQNSDIFESQADALVNPVNCKGVMGKGLALEFKKRFPECVPPYKMAVASGKFVPGVLLYVHLKIQPELFGIKRHGVILFPTKNHWRNPSRLEWIAKGLEFLRANYQSWGLKSIALPQLGTGLGGLNWQDVQPLFEKYLAGEPLEAEVYLNPERHKQDFSRTKAAKPASANAPTLFDADTQQLTTPLSDPIRDLVEKGPLEPIDLLDHPEKISNWIEDYEFDEPRYSVQSMMEQIVERDGVLVPGWWHKSTQEFLDAFNEEYALKLRTMSYGDDLWTAKQKQLHLLETLLYLWRLYRDAQRESDN